MKWCFSILLLLTGLFGHGQEILSDTKFPTDYNWFQPFKARIFLNNGDAINATITKITDSIILISTGDTTSSYDTIAIAEIDRIRIKRNSIGKGMTAGAAIGLLAGYGIGYISYSNDPSDSDEGNKESRQGQAILGALIGAVPGALIGGLATGIATKRTFVIAGKPENLIKLINALD